MTAEYREVLEQMLNPDNHHISAEQKLALSEALNLIDQLEDEVNDLLYGDLDEDDLDSDEEEWWTWDDDDAEEMEDDTQLFD